MNADLVHACEAWSAWASSADQSEDGWQSDFPQWKILMSLACATMCAPDTELTMLPQLELCWEISEETEDMADCARKYIEESWSALQHLARSARPDVRWQVFSVLPAAGRRAEPLLRVGLNDANAYCRRRALMALDQLGPHDASELKIRFLEDSDAGVRQVASSITVRR